MAVPHIREHEFSQREVDFLVSEARDYCLTNGMIYKNNNANIEHTPFTLFPSPFPRKLFTAAREVQTDFNLLVHKVSQDYEFTKNALSSTVAADSFTANLFDIYEKAWKQGHAQPISLGIFRSDYLVDTTGDLHDNGKVTGLCIKQVELNTVALGSISSSCRVPSLHRISEIKSIKRLGVQGACIAEPAMNSRHLLKLLGEEDKMPPPNLALDEAADGLIKAWELYGSPSAVIMFIVQPGEINVYAQRILEYHIRKRNTVVQVIRRSLTDIYLNSEMGNEKSLFVDGLEVAVAYFRAGYSPKHYPTEKEWSARLTVELSRCIKCPTVAHQLMGLKKMQQVFAGPRVLERFLPDKDSVDRVRRTFTGLYTLDPGPEGDLNVDSCLKAVDKFVLKPQREGGGNNIYGEDIRHTLLNNPETRSQYILMDRIQPNSVSRNILVRQELTSIRPVDVISELGIVGIIISRGEEILVNKEGGYLVKSKPTQYAEGGVLRGAAADDSPYLV